MVLVAPRSATLVASHGARFTLLAGYFFCLLGFLTMLLLWTDLQRDLGAAILQSVFGALLTAGHASALSATIASTKRRTPQRPTRSTPP